MINEYLDILSKIFSGELTDIGTQDNICIKLTLDSRIEGESAIKLLRETGITVDTDDFDRIETELKTRGRIYTIITPRMSDYELILRIPNNGHSLNNLKLLALGEI